MRRLALVALVAATSSAALAQSADLVGTWTVERLTDTAAAPVADGTLSALLPDNPYTIAPVALRLDAEGAATVTLLAARHDGYEVTDVRSTYRVEADHLTVSLGDLHTVWRAERLDDALLLTADDGSTLRLRRSSP